MSELKIFGYSDDLIEIEGDIRKEWDVYDAGLCYIGVSDGTLMGITYDDQGIWRINSITIGENTKYTNKQATSDENSDIVTLTGDLFKWIIFMFNKDEEPNPVTPAINKNLK